MSIYLKRATTALMLLGICFFATSSAVIVAGANSQGGSFDEWLATPGGQVVSQGAIDGKPGLSTAFKKVYEAKCGVNLDNSCLSVCTDAPAGACFEWTGVYSDYTCSCGI